MPASPEYAATALGKKLVEVAPKPSESCAGHLDIVAGRYAGDPGGVSVKGWAWNSGAKSPFAQIYAIDSFGTILAGGVVGESRPDVPAALPDTVLTDKVGWTVAVPVNSGNLTVVGLDPAAGTSCVVGTTAIPAL